MTRKQKRMLRRILATAGLLVAAFVVERVWLRDAALPWRMALYLPAYLLGGWDVLFRAGRNIAHGQVFDENFLMALATVGAMAVGFLPGAEPEFAEAVFVMVFYQTGELFQSVAVGKSRRSIASLMNIRPDSARVLRGGEEIEVSPESVAVGETVVLRPGEKIPLDGVILSGDSDIDTVALTGESEPRAVAPGGEVISGCTNLTGLLHVRVEKPYGESTVARVLRLIESASERKSRSEKFITRFARYYTPTVVIAAVVLALLPPLLMGDFGTHIADWLSRALTFLVISCPCALVISVPLSFFGGIGGASRIGVLIKGSNELEALARAETVVFDKTGTLTRGSFAVRALRPQTGTAEELLRTAAAAESQSNHPIARALREAAGGFVPVPTRVEERAGRGICAEVGGDVILAGNRALLTEAGIDCPEAEEVGSTVYVTRNGTYLGCIVIADTVKPGAADAIEALRRCGVRRMVMLTGDRTRAAAQTAEELGLTEWRAELLPADKVTEVETLLAAPHGGTLAFVGDGVNDAPVLTRADVGIAMGAMGSDAAIEAADVVLMDDDPRKIAAAVRHARRTLAIVRQNIVLALGIKAAVLVLGAAGLLGALQMPLAVFADVGVSVLAILNAMRALHVK